MAPSGNPRKPSGPRMKRLKSGEKPRPHRMSVRSSSTAKPRKMNWCATPAQK
jgi:hypothetical protein